MTLTTHMQDLRQFHNKFGLWLMGRPGHITKRKAHERAKFLQEELDEFLEAAETQDMALMADALVDLVYVAIGTAEQMGLADAWQDLWDDVHRANMAKVRGDTHRGNKADVMKPEGWEPPHTLKILAKYGYERSAFLGDGIDTGKTQEIDESKCGDDPEHKL